MQSRNQAAGLTELTMAATADAPNSTKTFSASVPSGPLAFDVTRLFLSPLSLSPRGIDRIELILAKYLFRERAENIWGVLPTPWGVRIYPAERVRRGLDQIDLLWAEHGGADDDPILEWLVATIHGETTKHQPMRRRLGLIQKAGRLLSMVRATGFAFGRSASHALPQNTTYFNAGHITLSLRPCVRWLEQRPDVRAIFMLHDAIPLEHPELVSPSSVQMHRRILENTARYAEGMIVTTQAARSEIERHLPCTRAQHFSTLALPLPLSKDFDHLPHRNKRLADCNYFLVCGAIEKRKNLTLLLDVWRRLTERLGMDTPDLILAGNQFFGFEEIRSKFLESVPTRGKTHFVHGLSTQSMKNLMHNSRGLLMPSLAEGFGLPIKEALAMRCPVVASDIPAHREVHSAQSQLLPANDIDAWTDAVFELATRRKRTFDPLSGHEGERCLFRREVELFLRSPPKVSLAKPEAQA